VACPRSSGPTTSATTTASRPTTRRWWGCRSGCVSGTDGRSRRIAEPATLDTAPSPITDLRSGLGQGAGVLDQRLDRHPGATRGPVSERPPGVEPRPRDVQVGPGHLADELAQEGGGEEPATPAHPVVLGEVGDLAGVHTLPHLLGDRHRPVGL